MIIDSSALLAILLGEPEAQRFTTAMTAAESRRMSVASYLEVALKVDRIAKAGADPILDVSIDRLRIELVPVSIVQGHAARDAFNRYGYSHPAKLNFGDCLTYALATTTGEPLLFKGNDFGLTDLELVSVED
ncbi:MAG: type II toxin-antitoxin system VapC family toxin [Sandarakinorhabdus sp.]|nr:type II toxin-antitoxin system VapC family toxin [Sandarakinorhabdus sp.]